ncbi:tRNA (uridine(54)-C5)-methyltransferase TrmA [Campylobacter mucosalis]|uniref:tRNA m5U54 methyltransferase n=1 Tax=Campylobacter mucosalis CCUG 21559 TaxID=1032067 RepID=A0A6G5QI32_9BACT|nr:tRNA (uridine(54)-C5)-methyltransferase TrmA [Campylobacter mucosalis]QCD45237.1 tRNA m5U54 methyltransferase [Campylobacter mucosalis CCUG 21559]
MDCLHLKECGSCTLFNPYDKQVDFKLEFLRENFSEFYGGDFEFFKSDESHYRTRAEFGIWHENDAISYTMNGVNGNKILIKNCPKVSRKIYDFIPNLIEILGQFEGLKSKLFGVEFIDSTSELLCVLLYHKRLNESFKNELEILKSAFKNVNFIARSKGVKIILDEPNLSDKLNIDDKIYTLNYDENAFIQPNKKVNESMIGWAKSCVKNGTDLLELYCGHGNFTLPLSENFRAVLATEISKSSIKNATKNCELNGIKNINFVRLSADELMSAFNREREFNRLKNLDIFSYDFSHILVDPPRAGLSKNVIEFIKNYENIIYISCNPATLKENLRELVRTHKIVKFAGFDQFANTHHLECGALLKRL